MILYTVLPPEEILPRPAYPRQELMEREGRFFSGERTPDGFCITRLISTCPADYLRADWQPGRLLGPLPPRNP